MLIVVTGQSGSGKSTLLKKTGLENIIYLDDVIKDEFYKPGEIVYEQIKEMFGEEYVNDDTVEISKLGKSVFNDEDELKKLNLIVKPWIVKYIQRLKARGDFIVEMAIYQQYEEEFNYMFDKVIQIQSKKLRTSDKFSYINGEITPVEDKEISFDKVIINDDIDKSSKELKSTIQNFLK